MKEIIFYTHNILQPDIAEKVNQRLKEIGLPIISVSLKPVDLGTNIILDLKPGITTMVKQILTGLETSEADVVFFCEHDVLYDPSHFDFTPPDDKFWYNTNVWRQDYPAERYITYDHLRSLSGLCVKREVALKHYRKKLKLIEDRGWTDTSREPSWIRRLGHEPGKKRSPIKEETDEWKSPRPNIDIRHRGCITRRKCQLEDFIHQPTGWQVIYERP